MLHLLIPPNPQLLATPELFTVSILLPFPEYHIVGITQYVGFSDFTLHRPEAVATTLECTALKTVRVMALWEEQSKESGPKQAAKAIPPVWGKGRQVGAGSRRALYAGVHHSILPRCTGSFCLSHHPLCPRHRESQSLGEQQAVLGSQEN